MALLWQIEYRGINMETIIGMIDGGIEVKLDSPANLHILAVGNSGSGKTTALMSALLQGASQGRKAIVINWRDSAAVGMLNPSQEVSFRRIARHIDAERDGIPLPLFTRQLLPNGELESENKLIGRIVSLLSKSGKLTATEEHCLSAAVETVVKDGSYGTEGIVALEKALSEQESSRRYAVMRKLSFLINYNLLRDGNLFDDDLPLVDFDLNGLEYEQQDKIVNLMLDYLLRSAQKGAFIEDGLTLFLDEAQNLDYSKGTALYHLINESRKQNVQLMIAATSMFGSDNRSMKIVQQCATKLFFSPQESECVGIAEMIDKQKSRYWQTQLSRLKRGQFIAVGSFMLPNRNIRRPLLLTAFIPEAKNNKI